MSSLPPLSQQKLKQFFQLGLRPGCPPDQLRNFVRAGIILQEKQLAASAAARLCDRPDGPTAIGYGLVGIEEATQPTARKYEDISTCYRTSRPDWRPRLYSATDPGDIGHQWYFDHIQWERLVRLDEGRERGGHWSSGLSTHSFPPYSTGSALFRSRTNVR